MPNTEVKLLSADGSEGFPFVRVGRRHAYAFLLCPKIVLSRGGGTGRRTGLKILRRVISVPVRFRSSASEILEKMA